MKEIYLGSSWGVLKGSLASSGIFSSYKLNEGFARILRKLEKMSIYYVVIDKIEVDNIELRERLTKGVYGKTGLASKTIMQDSDYGQSYSSEGSENVIGLNIFFKGQTKGSKEGSFYWNVNLSLGEGTSLYIRNNFNNINEKMFEYNRIAEIKISEMMAYLSRYEAFTAEGYKADNIETIKKEKLIFFGNNESFEKYKKIIKGKTIENKLNYKVLQDNSSKVSKIEENKIKDKYLQRKENELASTMGANIVHKGINGGVVYEVRGKKSVLYIGTTFAYLEDYEGEKQRLIYDLDMKGETIKSAQIKSRNLNNKLLLFTVSQLDLRSVNKFYDNVSGR